MQPVPTSTGLHMQNFLDAVHSRNHKDLHDEIAIAAPSAALCHLANISYRVGRRLTLEDGPRFAGDEEANKLLTRQPTSTEREQFVELLTPGYDTRVVPQQDIGTPHEERRFPYVSWSNHLNTEANVIKVEMQELVRLGPPPTRYLRPEWRERAEDAIWSLLNSPEMILIP